MFWIRRKTERIKRHTRKLMQQRDQLRANRSRLPERS
jgi:hypothetical protein